MKMISSDNPSAEAGLFQAAPREATLANRVTAQIEALSGEGRLHPAQRLPSGRELADQFGVSRTVVREAVRGLVAKGLLEVRPGSCTLIRSPSAHAVSQSMTLFLRASQPNLSYTKIY